MNHLGLYAWLAMVATVPASCFAMSETRAARDFVRVDQGFEENLGQASPEVRFIRRGSDGTLFLTDNAIVLASAEELVRIEFRDPTLPAARSEGLNPLPTSVSYFHGCDPLKWRTGIRRFAEVRYKGVAPGIDLVFREAPGGRLEYDLHIAPYADASALRLHVTGAEHIDIDSAGNLVIHTGCRDMVQAVPVLYAEGGGDTAARARYEIRDDHNVDLVVRGRDTRQALVIDPMITWSTYLGGSDADSANGVAVDALGNVYVTGSTNSIDFPTAGPLASALHNYGDAFVTKIDASGSFLIYSVYLGDSVQDDGYGIAVDSAGSACVTGPTASIDFPVVNAFQPQRAATRDAFVTKIAPDGGSLLFSTYLGGKTPAGPSGGSSSTSIAIDQADSIYVAGYTSTTDFPTLDAFQATYAGGFGGADQYDGFVTKFSPAGALVYSTYLGGSNIDTAFAIAVDAAGSAVVDGQTYSADFPTYLPLFSNFAGARDAFVAKLSPSGKDLVFSTYLGGSAVDQASAVAVDSTGAVLVGGFTLSTDFPLVKPFQPVSAGGGEAFVAKLDSSGSSVLFSTYLGGSDEDSVYSLAADAEDNVWIGGSTKSLDYPTRCAIQDVNKGIRDAFVAELDPAGSWLIFGTFLGGTGDDAGATMALDASGSLSVAISTKSTDFPTSPLAFQPAFGGGTSDAVVLKIDPSPIPLPGPVDNTLMLVKLPAGAGVQFNWVDAPQADFHFVRDDLAAAGPFDTIAGNAVSGAVGLQIPMPPEQLLLFRVSGANCKGEGPR